MATTLTGIVSSAKADKTITVTVTSRETHPLYGKQYTVTRKYAAHDIGRAHIFCAFSFAIRRFCQKFQSKTKYLIDKRRHLFYYR